MICEDLKGMRVLVTGASSGIGSAAAILFSRQDCYIGVHYFRRGGANPVRQERHRPERRESDSVFGKRCGELYHR